LAENYNATLAAYTLSRTCWLHMTEAVCWWKKIHVCAWRSPPPPHPQHTSRASLVSAKKNYIRYFWNRPRMMLLTMQVLPASCYTQVCNKKYFTHIPILKQTQFAGILSVTDRVLCPHKWVSKDTNVYISIFMF
jgi:hypothetical protein